MDSEIEIEIDTVSDFFEGFNAAAQRAAAEHKAREPSLPAKLKRLTEFFKTYREPCPFKPGDFVTATTDSEHYLAGEPNIVLEVLEVPIFIADSEIGSGSNMFRQRLDMRVGHFFGSTLTKHWVESSSFEPWVEKKAEKITTVVTLSPAGSALN